MRSFLDAKAIAKTLREELSNRNITLGHSECLEVVAKQFGFRDWNTMVAMISEGEPAHANSELHPLPSGWGTSGRVTRIYRYGVMPQGGPAGEPALLVGAKAEFSEKISHTDLVFCAIQQSVKANHFKGANVEFRLDLCGENIADRAWPFISVFDENARFIRSLEHWHLPAHMVIEGMGDWRNVEMVVNIPENAGTIEFGIVLHGFSGSVRAANLSFQKTSMPVMHLRTSDIDMPLNLDLRVA